MPPRLSDYVYALPDARIAKHPPAERGDSKLLVYRGGQITHRPFRAIADELPADALLVFNDTRVIPARIVLHKPTGARVEVFLLEPLLPSAAHEEVMNSTAACTWRCMIGNARKWRIGTALRHPDLAFAATRTARDEVRFAWTGATFGELLTAIGRLPLPPYIDRAVEAADRERYQTVYARAEGAVAAPTAGLHFTDEVLAELSARGLRREHVTLHVSAGTFQPVKSENVAEHPMHREQVWVHRRTVDALLEARPTIPVGTTSLRTLESLYWFGVRLHHGLGDGFAVRQNDPYELEPIDAAEALRLVRDHMDAGGLERIGGQTEVFFYPGYAFRVCDGLVTNFHQPGSTLVLLVAAFIGEDWRAVYEAALGEGYRFLSYGDSSLLLPRPLPRP